MKVALSPRFPEVAFTEPESLGHPVPEILSDVMRGEEGGAAATKAGATAARRKAERMAAVALMQLIVRIWEARDCCKVQASFEFGTECDRM